MNINVAILGSTGYTGAELIRLIENHPHFNITHLGAHSQAGKQVSDVLPGVASTIGNQTLAAADADLADDIQLVFTALPHGAAAESVKKALDRGKKVVDLSADFRHQSSDTYQQAYGVTHPHPELLTQAVYGLSEWARDDIRQAQLVANPGCYPTSTLLPLIPLLQAGVIDDAPIVVDSKSGTSGAGRSAKTGLLYCEINEGLSAYGLPRHRHVWEMEEWAQGFGKQDIHIRFVPHIVPMTRGMLSTLHLTGTDTSTWYELLSQAYAKQDFVRILAEGKLPSTKSVAGSNRCDIGLCVLSETEAVVVSCIDNLLKGASGQALQNANIMFGFKESLGLSLHAQWP
ncbi:MAG: N-acetyl-gamma-glutamyl-phosphate reductase [Proteobacteria bacterium]|nr:MAG: N-acetyl-gamma-glutamyl-phosphate reductase [Pseudomonadota bacterium]